MRVIKNKLFCCAFICMLALSLSGSLWAAPTFVNAAAPDLPEQALGVPKGGALTVFDLELEGEGKVTLELERFSVFAEDAELTVVWDSNTKTKVNPPTGYFRGWSTNGR